MTKSIYSKKDIKEILEKKKRTMPKKETKELRKWEYLEEQKCLVCRKPFVAKVYWAYGGTNLGFDHWVISSVYCCTKCAREGHKRFKEEK